MKLRLKIVPDAEPNADGTWITRSIPWRVMMTVRAWDWPSLPGYHVVSYRKPHRKGEWGLVPGMPRHHRGDLLFTAEELQDQPDRTLVLRLKDLGYDWDLASDTLRRPA